MSEARPRLLQLCPLSEDLEAALAARYDVIQWFALDEAERRAFLASHAGSVRAVVTGGHLGCPNALIEALPALGLVAVNGVGLDKVDVGYAAARGIRVTTTPDVLTDDVADLAVGLIISLLRELPAADSLVRAGAWPTRAPPLGCRVSGSRFGIVGLGKIGAAIARRLEAFGPVAYTSPRRKPVPYPYHQSAIELAAQSDVLVLACPATDDTRHLVDQAVLRALGPTGYLVNVARGSVVDEAALIDALDHGRIAGAALDVFEREPLVPEALRAHRKVVLTPHIGSATFESRRQMADIVTAEIDTFFAGIRHDCTDGCRSD